MPALSEYANRCPSPPSDYENDDATEEDQLGNYSRTEIIRLFIGLQKYMTNDIAAVGEEDICNVWDAVNSAPVADFLMQNDVINVLLLIIERCDNDVRLGEICAGIIANLLTNVSDEHLKEFNDATETILYIFFHERDPLYLHQVVRYCHTCLLRTGQEESGGLIAPILRQKEAFVPKLSFILSNCTNHQLLRDVLNLIELDGDASHGVIAITDEFFDAIFCAFDTLLTSFDFSHMLDSEENNATITVLRVLSDLVGTGRPISSKNVEFLLTTALTQIHKDLMNNREELIVTDIANFFDLFLYLLGCAFVAKQTEFENGDCLIATLDFAQFFKSSPLDYSSTLVTINTLLKSQIKILTRFNQFETFVPDNSDIEKKLLDILSIE